MANPQCQWALRSYWHWPRLCCLSLTRATTTTCATTAQCLSRMDSTWPPLKVSLIKDCCIYMLCHNKVKTFNFIYIIPWLNTFPDMFQWRQGLKDYNSLAAWHTQWPCVWPIYEFPLTEILSDLHLSGFTCVKNWIVKDIYRWHNYYTIKA